MKRPYAGGVAIAILAEELADQYKMLARSQRDAHRRALLRVAAEILEVLASEAVSDNISNATVERLEAIASFLRRNFLPYRRLVRLARLTRELGSVGPRFSGYGVPQFDRLNTTLS